VARFGCQVFKKPSEARHELPPSRALKPEGRCRSRRLCGAAVFGRPGHRQLIHRRNQQLAGAKSDRSGSASEASVGHGERTISTGGVITVRCFPSSGADSDKRQDLSPGAIPLVGQSSSPGTPFRRRRDSRTALIRLASKFFSSLIAQHAGQESRPFLLDLISLTSGADFVFLLAFRWPPHTGYAVECFGR